KRQKAHRVSWVVWRGDVPSGMNICHRCDTPSCINPEHLFLGTQLENIADMLRKRRNQYGERSGRRILTEAQARAIFFSTEKQSLLAGRYGVDPSVISHIKRKKIWAHIHE